MPEQKEIDALVAEGERLLKVATPGQWFALWKDDGDTKYPTSKPTAFEFVGIPTKGNILLGCEATVVAGRSVVKGSREQAQTHEDIRAIEWLHNNAPHLFAAVKENQALRLALEAERVRWLDPTPENIEAVYAAREALNPL